MDIALGSVVAISGGVGGAKMSLGLAQAMDPGQLVVGVNVGDDFDYLGLRICPDIDTTLYTLSGLNCWQRGWGRRDETWAFQETLTRLRPDHWFQLGDRDLALHVERSFRLSQREPLSTITRDFAERFGIQSDILPVTDDRVSTMVTTQEYGELAFQEYFVKRRANATVRAIDYRGADNARAYPPLVEALTRASTDLIVICPSNPLLSIGPIRAISEIETALRDAPAPVCVISPLRSGRAFKGPTAANMRDVGLEPSSTGVARLYSGFADAIVIDHADADQTASLRAMGLQVFATDIEMADAEACKQLAGKVLAQSWKKRHDRAA